MNIGLILRNAGVPTFPCWTRYDHAKGKFAKGPKVPKDTSWADVATWDPNSPELDWSSGVCGVPIPANVVVLDLDVYKGANRTTVEAALGVRLPWDRSLIQRTISGGEHHAFYVDWDVRQGDDVAGIVGFDTRATGRGFICTGTGYEPAGMGVFQFSNPALLPRLPDELRPLLERVEVAARERGDVHGRTSEDEASLKEALRYVNPGSGRSDWVRVGMALRDFYRDDEDRGYDVFAAWSAGEFWADGTPDNFVEEHLEKQWESFKPDGKTTAATVFYKAIEGGWRPPRAVVDAAGAWGMGGTGAASEWFDDMVERVRRESGDVRKVPGLIDDIKDGKPNALQTALLIAELKQAMKDSGIKDAGLNKTIDSLFCVYAPSIAKGARATGGQVIDHNTPLHPDMWAPLQTKGKDNKPKGTLRNFEIMLSAYGISIQFDEVRKTLEISGPAVPGQGVLQEEAALSFLESLANLNEYPVASARAMVPVVANNNTVNPVREYIASEPWDGMDHVGALWSNVQLDPAEDRAFCECLFRKWLRGAYAIGAGYLDRWEYVVVLIDPLGGAGKTRFFSTLCPRDLRADSVVLDTSNKDSVKQAISYWLTELGELDSTFNRSESGRIKAFLSQAADEMRLPYARAYIKYPRRTAFFASVNETHFLLDPSDNRRFWGIRVTYANHQHGVNMQQVWAQSAAEFHAGQQAYLTPQEDQILRERNEAFRSGSAVADALGTLTINADPAGMYTGTEILALAGMAKATSRDINEAARWLTRRGFQEVRRGGRRGYAVEVIRKPPVAFELKAVPK